MMASIPENEKDVNTSKEITEQKAKEQRAALPVIIILTLYLVLLSALFIYGLITFWPAAASTETSGANQPNTTFFAWSFYLSGEIRMILIVVMAGALGSLVHAFRSLFWYVGNKAFAKNWVLMYLLLPFIGSSMALVFYFVIRGGLFSPQVTVDSTSPFGFAGLSGLVGMFSNQAALKLQEVAESVFSTKGTTQGKDSVPTKGTTQGKDGASTEGTEPKG